MHFSWLIMSNQSKQVAMINNWFKNPLVSGFFVAGQATNNGKFTEQFFMLAGSFPEVLLYYFIDVIRAGSGQLKAFQSTPCMQRWRT
jgi:hypothetical protein